MTITNCCVCLKAVDAVHYWHKWENSMCVCVFIVTDLCVCCHFTSNCDRVANPLPTIAFLCSHTHTGSHTKRYPKTETPPQTYQYILHLFSLPILSPLSLSLSLSHLFVDASLISSQCTGGVYLSPCGNIPCDSVNKSQFKIHLF